MRRTRSPCCVRAASGHAAIAHARKIMKSRRLIPGSRSDDGQGLWLKRATSDRLRDGQLSTRCCQPRGGPRMAASGREGAKPERPVSDRSTDLCCGVPGEGPGAKRQGQVEIADPTLLARPAPTAVRRFRSFASLVIGPLWLTGFRSSTKTGDKIAREKLFFDFLVLRTTGPGRGLCRKAHSTREIISSIDPARRAVPGSAAGFDYWRTAGLKINV